MQLRGTWCQPCPSVEADSSHRSTLALQSRTKQLNELQCWNFPGFVWSPGPTLSIFLNIFRFFSLQVSLVWGQAIFASVLVIQMGPWFSLAGLENRRHSKDLWIVQVWMLFAISLFSIEVRILELRLIAFYLRLAVYPLTARAYRRPLNFLWCRDCPIVFGLIAFKL